MCGGWRKADNSELQDLDSRTSGPKIFFFLNRGIFSLCVFEVDRKVRGSV